MSEPESIPEWHETFKRARWPLVRLTIACMYSTARGDIRIFQLTETWGRLEPAEYVSARRQHAFKWFDHAFFNELRKRGEFYGSSIGPIESHEETTDHDIRPKEWVTDVWSPKEDTTA